MRLAEVERTSIISWSPNGVAGQPLLAVGTAAQQLDATFSTNAELEIFSFDKSAGENGLVRTGVIPANFRFHSLTWGAKGVDSGEMPQGVIAGGMDGGVINVWNVASVLQGAGEHSLVARMEVHHGAVRTLDFNPYQGNLLASGASDSEIYIWDLNNPQKPMTPGSRPQQTADVACIQWNRQVQHILASTSMGTGTTVWDLRANRPVLQINDPSFRFRSRAFAWHPDVATQVAIASEEDRAPIIQVWDLRNAYSPMKSLERHSRGILSVAWCQRDSDLLISSGKDNRTLVWNPNSAAPGGDVVAELPPSANWNFDVQWCVRDPSLMATASFEGKVAVHSLTDVPSVDAHAAAGDQFFSQSTPKEAVLRNAPKWLRRPVSAAFGFGGRIASVTPNTQALAAQQQQQQQQGQPGQPAPQPVTALTSVIHLRTVETELDVVERARLLKNALDRRQYLEYCTERANETIDGTSEKDTWEFLRAGFEKEPRRALLALLGYDTEEVVARVSEAVGLVDGVSDAVEALAVTNDNVFANSPIMGASANGLGSYATQRSVDTPSSPGLNSSSPHDFGAHSASGSLNPFMSNGNVPIPFGVGVAADGGMDSSFDASANVPFISVSKADAAPFAIETGSDIDGLVSQALLVGNFDAAVNACVSADRMADALILAMAGGPELVARTQAIYFKRNKSNLSRLTNAVVTRNWRDIVDSADIANWRETLALLCTYARTDEFASLCGALAERIDRESADGTTTALLVYICAGDVERVVDCWIRIYGDSTDSGSIQTLIEKIAVLKQSVVEAGGSQATTSGSTTAHALLAHKYRQYAEVLASQGHLATAMEYLTRAGVTDVTQGALAEFLDRLYAASGADKTGLPRPVFPFERIDVQATPTPQQPQQPPQQPQQAQYGQANAYGQYGQPAQGAYGVTAGVGAYGQPQQSQYGAYGQQQQPPAQSGYGAQQTYGQMPTAQNFWDTPQQPAHATSTQPYGPTPTNVAAAASSYAPPPTQPSYGQPAAYAAPTSSAAPPSQYGAPPSAGAYGQQQQSSQSPYGQPQQSSQSPYGQPPQSSQSPYGQPQQYGQASAYAPPVASPAKPLGPPPTAGFMPSAAVSSPAPAAQPAAAPSMSQTAFYLAAAAPPAPVISTAPTAAPGPQSFAQPAYGQQYGGPAPPAAGPAASEPPRKESLGVSTADKRWNDPPPIKFEQPRPAASGPLPVTTPMPVTQPLAMGPGGQYGAPQMVPIGAQGPVVNQMGNQMGYGVSPQSMQQQQHQQQQQQQQQQQLQQQQQQQAPAPLPPPEPEKPIPQEYLPIVQMLDQAFDRIKPNNPTLKKRMEDVRKRLNNLNDAFRNRSLPENIVSALATLAQGLLNNDLQLATNVHSYLASTGNIDMIGYWMVGIKNLIQISRNPM